MCKLLFRGQEQTRDITHELCELLVCCCYIIPISRRPDEEILVPFKIRIEKNFLNGYQSFFRFGINAVEFSIENLTARFRNTCSIDTFDQMNAAFPVLIQIIRFSESHEELV